MATVSNLNARVQLLLNNGTDSQGNVTTKSMTLFSTAFTNENIATTPTAYNAMQAIISPLINVLALPHYKSRIVTTSDLIN